MTFKEYKKIRQLGHEENQDIFKEDDEIIIQEKMDGANFRFMIKDGKLIVGSRTQQLHEDIEHKYSKNFRRCIDHVSEKTKDIEIQEGLVYYGECMVSHTMAYDWEKVPPYLGFDIYDLRVDSFIPWPLNLAMFDEIGLDMVPLIKTVKASEITEVNDESVPESRYFHPEAKNTQAEGIVFKNYTKGIFAKYVRDAFKEANAETFGGNPKYNKTDDTDNEKIAFKYCTNARIDKMVFKLVDEGHKLEMAMMKHLPGRVYEDIMAEEWQALTFWRNRYKIDFYKLHKLITKRCTAVLKQIMITNAL